MRKELPANVVKNFLPGIVCALFLFSGGIAAQSVGGGNYRIGSGDVLKVVVAKQPLLSLDSVRVSNEGTIRLPMIEGEIPAACQTEAGLTEIITEKYKKYLLNPQVYVAVQEFNSNPVAVLGAVNAPGRFDVRRPTRLLELLTFVNGPTEKAGERIQIFRTGGSGRCEAENFSEPEGAEAVQQLIVLSLADTLKGGETSNPYVQAGDIITVDEAEQPGEAYIIGNVKAARTITLDEPTTLSQAVAMAGGVTGGAQIDKIKISRQDPKTLTKTEIIADLKKINKDKAGDILLQPNDIIEVPGPSGTKKFLRDIFKVIVPTVRRGIIPFP